MHKKIFKTLFKRWVQFRIGAIPRPLARPSLQVNALLIRIQITNRYIQGVHQGTSKSKYIFLVEKIISQS